MLTAVVVIVVVLVMSEFVESVMDLVDGVARLPGRWRSSAALDDVGNFRVGGLVAHAVAVAFVAIFDQLAGCFGFRLDITLAEAGGTGCVAAVTTSVVM